MIENNYFPLLQLTVMIFVFLGLVAGFGGLLAIVFHFFSSLGFLLLLDFLLSWICSCLLEGRELLASGVVGAVS